MSVQVCIPSREARFALEMAVHLQAKATDERTRLESVRLANRLREGLEPWYAMKRQQKREQKARWIARHREHYLEKCKEYERAKRARRRAERVA